eukprot:666852-Pyramimonas_sp.AAC.1
MHVHDFSLNERRADTVQCIVNLAAALASLINHLAQLLNLTFAMQKFCIAGASEQPVTAAKASLCQCAGDSDVSLVNLGGGLWPWEAPKTA